MSPLREIEDPKERTVNVIEILTSNVRIILAAIIVGETFARAALLGYGFQLRISVNSQFAAE